MLSEQVLQNEVMPHQLQLLEERDLGEKLLNEKKHTCDISFFVWVFFKKKQYWSFILENKKAYAVIISGMYSKQGLHF